MHEQPPTNTQPNPNPKTNAERFPGYRAVSVVVNGVRVERGLDDDLSDLSVYCDPYFVLTDPSESSRGYTWGTCYRDCDGRLHLCLGANGDGKHIIVEPVCQCDDYACSYCNPDNSAMGAA